MLSIFGWCFEVLHLIKGYVHHFPRTHNGRVDASDSDVRQAGRNGALERIESIISRDGDAPSAAPRNVKLSRGTSRAGEGLDLLADGCIAAHGLGDRSPGGWSRSQEGNVAVDAREGDRKGVTALQGS